MQADPDKSFVENICLPFLRNSQNADGGWGFHPNSESRAEPTCWALQAVGGWPSRESEASLAHGFEYLRAAQLPDGSWPATPADPAGCWVTSLSCWVLSQAADSVPNVAVGLRWICKDWPADTTPWRRMMAKLSTERDVAPINISYRGWAWTPGTSSWVEPTSFALIALEHAKPQSLPPEAARRRKLGEALLYDRMCCPGGGWNCGNPLVYGVPGEPMVVPTVWALIALRHHPVQPQNVLSLQWLASALGSVQSAGSLALARICMKSYGREWPDSAPSFHDLYERNGFLESVQVAAWTCLALAERKGWLAPAGTKANR
jgi:hypothetical protein